MSMPKELNLIAFVSALGLTFFHFAQYVGDGIPKILYTFANGNFFVVFTALFLLVCSAALYEEYPCLEERKSISGFWKKKAADLYPIYWFAFIWYYFQNALYVKNAFYAGSPAKLILSAIGFDGYIFQLSGVGNYYQIGEYLFGEIIFVCLLYPLLLKAVRKNMAVSFGISFLLYIFTAGLHIIPSVEWYLYPTVWIFLVVTAMVFMKHVNRLRHPAIFVFSLAVVVFIWKVHNPLPESISAILMTLAVFIVLLDIAYYAVKVRTLDKILEFAGGISLALYLVQNKVVVSMMRWLQAGSTKQMALSLVITCIMAIVVGWLLKITSDALKKGFLNMASYIRRKEQ